MKNTEGKMKLTNKTIGLVLAGLGFAFLLLNAIEYLSGRESSGSFTAIGLMLVVIGMGFNRKK